MTGMDKAGLYIHVPFCRRKCAYCDFFSVPSTGAVPRWLQAISLEASLCRSFFSSFDTVYLGGGTPSFLAGKVLETLMDEVVSIFPVQPGAEITIEANPCDLDQRKIRLFQRLGFNRISIGVQSFDDGILAFLGRFHDGGQAEKALQSLRSLWSGSISVDLIYAVPGQSERLWLSSLEKALSFEPDHLSCYQLSVEKGTRLQRLEAEGLRFPGEPLVSRLFVSTSDFLAARGFLHYEVSNFAAGAGFRSRHNMKYWRHAPYLGLGPSAHSFDGTNRWWNVRSVRSYCRMLETGGLPVAGKEMLGESDLRQEAVLLGLRTSEGIEAEMVADTVEAGIFLESCRRMGIVDLRGGRIVPTVKGLLMADHLALSLC